jgi:hypothetical protein
MTSLALYELASEFRAVADQLADMDLPPEVVADTLEAIAQPLEQKCTNVAAFARNLEAAADQIKAAEAEMARRRKAIEARAASLREYLLSNMQRCGIQKIESPWFRIAVRANPESVVIDDESAIPVDYQREIPARHEPDKAAMKSAMRDGFVIPGAHLARTQRIEIK